MKNFFIICGITLAGIMFHSCSVEKPERPSQEGNDGPGIRTAQDLTDFASAVNSGASTEQWQDEEGTVHLLADIDMSSVTRWTPIGNGEFHGSTSSADRYESHYRGAAFKGVFDGNGFSIKNIRMSSNLTAGASVFGLFGILDHATVRNLTVGAEINDASSLTFSARDTLDAGVFAGAMLCSTLENCVNYAKVHVKGNSTDNMRTTAAGFAGFIYADKNMGCTLKNLTNYGSIKAEPGENTQNGITSVMAGGILGIASAASGTSAKNIVSACTNHGEMTSSVPRTAGIAATVSRNTILENCTNLASQTNSSKDGRVGMITAILSTGSSLVNCENHGDAVMTGGRSAQAGGLVCQLADITVSISGGGNYGKIISDISSISYKGTLVANFNEFEKVENVTAGGKIGEYNGGNFLFETITSDNYMKFIGKYPASNAYKIRNIIFKGDGPEVRGIDTAGDFVEFAAAVNSGTSTEQWQDEDGGINMLADIDLSSITDWIPVGNATCIPGTAEPEIKGNAWTGKFDGNGHKISGLKIVADGNVPGSVHGLFGVVAPGAEVRNLILDASCSLTVTATATCASGIVAGYVLDGTVRDVTSYAPMTFNGKAGNSFMSMGLVGQIYGKESGVTMDSCHNYGNIKAENTDNLNTDTNAYHIAGLVGFSSGTMTTSVPNTVSDCSNYGKIVSSAGLTSGICAANTGRIQFINCVNHGNQTNSFPVKGAGLAGNITCMGGKDCNMTGCVNYGNITSVTAAYSGGLAAIPGSLSFSNCSNFGEIISDNEARGLFWGKDDGQASASGCKAGGKVGKYNAGSPQYDEYPESQRLKYLGLSEKECQVTDITWLIGITDPGTGSEEAELSILFIGNSFTRDAVDHLPGLIRAAGLNKVHLTHMYYGGRVISQYYTGWDINDDYKCYECRPGTAFWDESTGITLEEAAASRHWDIITFQEHTGNSAAWLWNESAKNNLQGVINKARATQSGVMPKFWYILSQAYSNMDKIASSSKPYITWSDQNGMWETISSFGKNMMEEVSFDGIISTGVMLQNLRTSSLDNKMNLTRDGYHMDNGISRYGAACTVFESLITPKFNVTLDGNTYRYNVSNQSDTYYTTPVTDQNAPIALKAARLAIADPFNVTRMTE